MQFLVVAMDGTDEDALARRLAVREAHLANAKKLKQDGTMIEGGAILDADGRMIGSACLVDFPSRAELDAWLDSDPYVTGDVWRDIKVSPIKLATR
ncbi:MAG: YciI family protein [Alphaproteobacteria bacterium]|jgi:uncharacterized protein YciI|nr:YciI family protein [Alphaproteobacteria bacterium]